ncbi:unnamed protein product, partial [Ectocarpus sp. 12 AP-2014]
DLIAWTTSNCCGGNDQRERYRRKGGVWEAAACTDLRGQQLLARLGWDGEQRGGAVGCGRVCGRPYPQVEGARVRRGGGGASRCFARAG